MSQNNEQTIDAKASQPESSENGGGIRIDETNRKYLLAGVFITAASIIYLEIVFFQVLMYISSYLKANQIISIALLGIAIGGLAGFYLAKGRSAAIFVYSSMAFALSIGLCFYLAIIMSTDIVKYDFLLGLPFIFGSLTLSLSFALTSSNRVYFADLSGAGLSTIVVALMVGTFREENALFALMAFVLISTLFYSMLIPKGTKRLTLQIITAVLIAGAGTLFFFNLATDKINMAEDIRGTADSRSKAFSRIQLQSDTSLKFSRSSVVARCDLIRQKGKYKTCENGDIIDTVRSIPAEQYVLDPRIPPPNFVKDPDSLIIGTSGEGVLKPMRMLGKGQVYGVEINPAVYKMMTNEAAKLCGNCYKDIITEIIDARSYMRKGDHKFDYITLMNAHFTKGEREDKLADPEYLQTREAITDYFNRMTDRGSILIEERDHHDEVNRLQTLREIYTYFETMKEMGIEHPEKHFIVWDWAGSGSRALFIQFIIKKTPITKEDHEVMMHYLYEMDHYAIRKTRSRLVKKPKLARAFYENLIYVKPELGAVEGEVTHEKIIEFIDEVVKRKDTRNPRLFSPKPMHLLYSPFAEAKDTKNLYGDFIRLKDKLNYKPNKVNIAVNTDNKPFPFNVYMSNKPLNDVFAHFLKMALVVLIPLLGFLFWRAGKNIPATIPHILYFGLLGVGYLLVEIVLIQRFNHFLGSPIYSLIFVLGAMLLASGLGSYFSRNFTRKGAVISVVVVIGILTLFILSLSSILAATQQLPLILKIFVSLALVGPVGFFMGIPFPHGLNVAKVRFSAEYGAIMFGLNGIFSSFGTPLSMMSSVNYGFKGTFFIGILIYVAILPLFFWMTVPKQTSE